MDIERTHVDWACMAGDSFRLRDKNFRSEVLNFARKMMAPVKRIVAQILDELESENYQFINSDRVFKTPESDVLEWLEKYEEAGIYLPISVQAWLIEVGTVNLMGTHKNWPKTAYAFDEETQSNEVWYTDPLVVEIPKDYIEYLFDEWKSRVDEEGFDNIGPFKVDFSPDYLIKANISGGLPYEVTATPPAVESLVFNERTCTSFTNYIRNSLSWSGFPGFAYIQDVENFIVDRMKKNTFLF